MLDPLLSPSSTVMVAVYEAIKSSVAKAISILFDVVLTDGTAQSESELTVINDSSKDALSGRYGIRIGV